MKQKKSIGIWTIPVLALFAVAALAGCEDEVDKSNRFTFTGELISTHLENNPQFSSFTTILSKAKIGKKASGSILKTLSTYGSYTCFAPQNEAVDSFLQKQYDLYLEGERTGITSPYLEDLTDSMATEIAKNHIIEMGYKTTDIYDGAFPMSTMNHRFTTVEWTTNEAGQVFPLLNNSARIINQDLEMENGYIQVIDAVLSPSNKLLPELIEAQQSFRIFCDAMKLTGVDSLLSVYDLDPDYDNTLTGPSLDSETSTSPYPKEKKQKYTVLIEPDALYNSNGIYNLEDLKAFAENWYGTEAQNDYKNDKNALRQFILYHVIDRQLLYSSSTGPGGFIMENYENQGYSSIVNLNQRFDSYEYYETMLPYTMIKVTKPYTNEELKTEIILNYSKEMGSVAINPEMKNHLNVVVDKATATKEKYPELTDFDQSALNGIIHTIDRILIYNEDEMAGNVLNERIRMDISALFPELTNNSVRWDLSSPGNVVTFIPNGFCKYFVVNNTDTEVFYFRPHQTYLGSYANYQGDEFIVEGKYDFQYRIPHVPAGDYEIRFGYPRGYYRGVCQFYVDGKIAGIPVDLRWSTDTDLIIGWVADTGLSEDEIKENDKAMKNRGYMKGPSSIILDKDSKGTMRDSEQSLRKIIGTYRLGKSDHWLRFKDVTEGGTGKLNQFDQDYIELVPTIVLSDPNKPEDTF
ncbi:MAG: fasciclin domain-containing protein [Bacteroidaceae bacterium]|nr:fasciclin domain-containing protein [Bacteroidaceae bacterium]